jgi:hypothetical protein
MASQTAILAQLGPSWRYDRRTRGYISDSGERISRRQADVRYGRLKEQGFTSYESKAAARRQAGVEPGPARGRTVTRTFQVPHYDSSAFGMTIEPVSLDKRTASRMGRYWSDYQAAITFGRLDWDIFRKRWDRRVVWDKAHSQRMELVGDVDLILRYMDTLTDEEQEDLWANIYKFEQAA